LLTGPNFFYAYLANSAQVEQIAFKQSGTTRMTTTKAYDYLNRLTSISHADATPATLASYAYGYNAANQRTNVVHADGSYWNYGYDALGQVITAKKRKLGDLLFPGLQYEFEYDDIGNRTQTRTGGDASGANLRTNNYTANALNQYTSRDIRPYVEVHGQAATNATVTVNNLATERAGTFFRKELNPDNSAAVVNQGITNVAVLKNAGPDSKDIVSTETGNRLLPQNPENFTYDADGNLLSDGLWNYVWNGENRLIELTASTNVPATSRKKLEFSYDHQGRRRSKTVYTWNSGTSSYESASTNLFVYDGWNLIAELNPNATLIRSYVWGLDLSGSEQGAGGVGGLLMVTDSATHFAGHDGNGNVMLLVSADTATITAQYEYSPFGKVIRASGTMADANPIRFSGKYEDSETGYNYYGLRFYNPDTGRWLNRDPIEELGGSNVYCFVLNFSSGYFDLLGLKKCGGEGTFSHTFFKDIHDLEGHDVTQYFDWKWEADCGCEGPNNDEAFFRNLSYSGNRRHHLDTIAWPIPFLLGITESHILKVETDVKAKGCPKGQSGGILIVDVKIKWRYEVVFTFLFIDLPIYDIARYETTDTAIVNCCQRMSDPDSCL
jgi:RHS repeat-associated protein